MRMRYSIIGLMLFLLVISTWAGTLRDDFSDGDFDGWQIENLKGGISEWSVDNGTLVCRRPSMWSSFLIIGEKEWRNYSIEFDVKMVEVLDNFHAIGFDMRVQDVSNAVWFALGNWDGLKVWITVWANPDFVKESKKDFNFELNRWYWLKGTANGNNFEFYVDGKLLVSLSDVRFPTGRLSLTVNGSVAYFDNVVITGDDVPDQSLFVNPKAKLATRWATVKQNR